MYFYYPTPKVTLYTEAFSETEAYIKFKRVLRKVNKELLTIVRPQHDIIIGLECLTGSDMYNYVEPWNNRVK